MALSAVLLAAHVASAEDDPTKRADARAAYERGSRLLEAGDDDDALAAYIQADSIVPSAQALEAAALAAERAKAGADFDTLCRRVEERAIDPLLRDRARNACDRAGLAYGSVEIACDRPCDARFDGKPFAAGTVVAASTGTHELIVGSERSVVEIHQHDHVLRSFRAPVDPPGAHAPVRPVANQKPLSPGWFVGGAVLTAAMLGGTIASGVDASSQHGRFVDDRCALASSRRTTSNASCASLADAGAMASTRTNVLVGVTAALGVATGLVGILAVRWSTPEAELHLSVGPSQALLRGAF